MRARLRRSRSDERRQTLFGTLAAVGFAVPVVSSVVQVLVSGTSVEAYAQVWFSGFALRSVGEAALGAAVLGAWTWWDGPRSGVRGWWLTIPATLVVGLTFALPLYLYLRERTRVEERAPARRYRNGAHRQVAQ